MTLSDNPKIEIRKEYKVLPIDSKETYPWILKKHYAHRLPSISYAFGLWSKNRLIGICTFGFPPNHQYNNGKCVFSGKLNITTIELNRLCVNDGLPKNALSFFVSNCLKMLPKPSCIVSYADPNFGHKGYIYQATNWIYTGESTPKFRYHFEDGSTFDIRRGIHTRGKLIKKERILSTHRYFQFLGDKKQVKEMKKNLKYKILPYPKGDNKNYDASYKPETQQVLF